MSNKASPKDKFIQAIQKDPMLIGFVMNIDTAGLDFLTDHGTLILQYHNPKTKLSAILDPAKPTIFIHDGKEGFNISIRLAISIIKELYGTPEIIEIPKIGTNIPLNWHTANP
jgi:hypothetical protein